MEQTPLGHRQQQDHQQQPCSTPGGAPKPASTQRNTPCKFYAAGGCNRGDSCFFKHDSEPSPLHTSGPSKEVSLPTASRIDKQEENAYACVICFDEKPISYGLLEGCSHSFCLECIRAWRAAGDKDHSVIMSGVIKTCPACRAPSSFITPSTKFYPSGHPMKIRTIEGYKANLAKIPCKYFIRRRGPNRYCPFGRDCFYQHQNIDGTPYVFEHGTEEMLAAQQRRNARRARAADFAWFQDTLNSIADNLITSNFDAFMASMGGLGDPDEDQDEDEDEDEDEGEDEVDEDDEDVDEDDWDDSDEDVLQDALHNRWMSERALMEFFQRHSNGEASESGAESDEPAPPRRQSASDADTPLAPTFVSASTVPRRQNRGWRR